MSLMIYCYSVVLLLQPADGLIVMDILVCNKIHYYAPS